MSDTSAGIQIDMMVKRSKSKASEASKEERLYQRRIGQVARDYRESLPLSLRKLAKKMNLSAAFVSDLERGNRIWNEKTVRAWRRAMGI